MKVQISMLLLLSILCMMSVCFVEATALAEHPIPVLGWIEKVQLGRKGIVVHAKLDTGADHSSLHAQDIQIFKKNGKKWVRFKVRNRYGQTENIEVVTHRVARIKRAGGAIQERRVIRLGLCLGGKFMEVDVNLVDRSSLSFPMLIGRGFLAGNAIVDSSKTYTTDPVCSNSPNTKE